ncbi:MAG: hypothetical protein KAR00_01450 [Candidatus Pacebacteria bacterium]|nr:hypothetical protein [Candidatus Paceibacterota bacterium]
MFEQAIQFINQLVIILGIPTLIVGFISIGKKLKTVEIIEGTIEKIKNNVKAIGDYLIRDGEFDPSELQTYSPLTLTEKGKNLIETLNFEKIFEEHKKDFFDIVNSEEPKLKYDVEVAAIKSIYLLSDKEYMNFLKIFFYNKPNRTLENTAPTLGIYVRDMYLKENSQIIE